MNIQFKQLVEDNISDFELITKWDNDVETKYFIRPNFKEGEIEDIGVDELIAHFKSINPKFIYIILYNGIKIGYVSVESNVEHLYTKDKNSAWISICIGEKEYRGMGIGEYAMGFLEEKSKKLNCDRIELGVFEYNKTARAFYEKIGYTAIAIIKDFVYYNGQWRNDIRMEKNI
ncbi:MAG: GNAT family N-acetyltransferase [Oscillospiraceae bacterium]